MYLNEGRKLNPNNVDWLTLTWDVFKCYICSICFSNYIRLTLTWDVFKSLNIPQDDLLMARLTLTWDVFKYFYSLNF